MLTNVSTFGQSGGGNQILDGIGETELIARYVFDGDLKDWSRNGWHASIEGKHGFVDDETFGKVLSLPGGKDGGFVTLPGKTLAGVGSLSVTAWVRIDAVIPEQCLFDLGIDARRHFSMIPMGAKRVDGCRVTMVTPGKDAGGSGPASFSIAAGQWVHLAAVLDTARKSLGLYVDGVRVGQTQEVKAALSDVLDAETPEKNQLRIGRSLFESGGAFHGKLHDVRFYSSALSDPQVAVIRHNAISKDKIEVGAAPSAANDHEDRARPLVLGLTEVPDVLAETRLGYLPRLPREVPGKYRAGTVGPLVRVIWPSPKNNEAVLKPGSYTIAGRVPGTEFRPKATVNVIQAAPERSVRKIALESFPLDRVVLNPDPSGRATPFMKHRDKFIAGLAKTDPDAFLYNFRDAFGQKQPEGVKPLMGWDSQTTRLRGHASGHYLTAIAQACASTRHDPDLHALFSRKMDCMIDVLHDLSMKSGKPASAGGPSNADPCAVPHGDGRKTYDSDLSKDGIRTDYWMWGEGFLSGYPPDQFIMLEQGATYGTGNHQVWAPYYTLHKILAGLVDCYEVGGNPKALEIAHQMGLWVYRRLNVLTPETRARMWSSYIAGEYGGMNEIMARMARLTGDVRLLAGAKLFDNTHVFFGDAGRRHGLARNVDTIRGLHANQHIPQIIGAVETFKSTNDSAYLDVADHFWEICNHSYMYSIGGVAGARNPNNAECFPAEPDTLFANGFSDGGQNETCATYNLLKLDRQLFLMDQDSKRIDHYERAIYNHILASVDEDNPGNTYHVPLNPGAQKSFGNSNMDAFTCCNGTALESATKLQDTIYFQSADHRELYVNLYIPSTLDWRERGVKVTQETGFPYEDSSRLILKGGGEFAIHVRVPSWVKSGCSVEINGEKQNGNPGPGGYLALERNWKDGDRIELKMPMGFHFDSLMDRPNIASVFYGPILLAAVEPEPRKTWRRLKLSAMNPGGSFAGNPETLRFKADGTDFKPFHEIYRENHSVYLDIRFEPDP